MAQLCAYLKSPVFSPSCTAPQRYTYVRDMAFFCLDFYTGDRGSDLGRVFTKEVALLPDKQGFLFRHTFGKTLRGGGKSNTFQIKKVFRQQVLSKNNEVSDDPFVGSAIANRLSLHLKSAGIHNGETMHSFRRGCSITLSLLGVPYEEIARHVGWSSVVTAEYYTQKDKELERFHKGSSYRGKTECKLFIRLPQIFNLRDVWKSEIAEGSPQVRRISAGIPRNYLAEHRDRPVNRGVKILQKKQQHISRSS
ncbi:predicted protein [Nematostella vectensis]|uniref:Tyr recombinase domain-containing protein n=1 Tax=Nematostella vectensis TaxID=45351 RepID=A7SBF9_NEMVE|nr:predicted protein [Nematostella vectensis]|eukprot:XP_001631004.1 predicted protein [Nematostella vectensis]